MSAAFRTIDPGSAIDVDPGRLPMTDRACLRFLVRCGVATSSQLAQLVYRKPRHAQKRLLQFHQLIWERTKDVAQGISPLYAPDVWVPHITLGLNDVSNANLACAMQSLAFRDFAWEITVDNIAFIGC